MSAASTPPADKKKTPSRTALVIKALGFRYDARQDRILCTGTRVGASTSSSSSISDDLNVPVAPGMTVDVPRETKPDTDGVATVQKPDADRLYFWLTRRLASGFLDRINAELAKPDGMGAASKQAGQGASAAGGADTDGTPGSTDLLRYGNAVEQARADTDGQMEHVPAIPASAVMDVSWLAFRVTLKKTGERWQLLFMNDDDAVAIPLLHDELLRIVDMLETVFVQAGWILPDNSYRNVGRIAAEEHGQRLN